MGRTLKPQKVKDVRDKNTGIDYAVILDRNNLIFFAEPAPGVRIEASTAEECVTLLKEKFSELVAYDWKPYVVIDGPEIEEARRSRASWYNDGKKDWIEASVSFKFRRTERSPHPGGEKNKYVERVHREDLPEAWTNAKDRWDKEHLKDWENGKDHSNVWPSPSDIYLPYTPELWARMLRMKEVLDKAAADLEALLRVGQEDKERFLATLSGGGVKLLGSGTEYVPTRSERRASK